MSSTGVAQLVDPRTLLLALHFTKAADNPYFRIGYNSLGAYGTINHLHFQVRLRSEPANWQPSSPMVSTRAGRAWQRMKVLFMTRKLDFDGNKHSQHTDTSVVAFEHSDHNPPI